MRRTMILAGVVLALVGCAAPEERMAGYRERCQNTFGFTPNTEAFSNCLMQQENQRQRRIDAALAAPLPTAPAPAPIYIPPMQFR